MTSFSNLQQKQSYTQLDRSLSSFCCKFSILILPQSLYSSSDDRLLMFAGTLTRFNSSSVSKIILQILLFAAIVFFSLFPRALLIYLQSLSLALPSFCFQRDLYGLYEFLVGDPRNWRHFSFTRYYTDAVVNYASAKGQKLNSWLLTVHAFVNLLQLTKSQKFQLYFLKILEVCQFLYYFCSLLASTSMF